jgi:hypothetical protein
LTEEKKVPSNSSYYDHVSFDNLDWGNSALLALEVPERPKLLKLRKGLAVAHVFFIPLILIEEESPWERGGVPSFLHSRIHMEISLQAKGE